MVRIKKPNYNNAKNVCILCNVQHDENTLEYPVEWFSYMCEECMHNHAKRWGYEFE